MHTRERHIANILKKKAAIFPALGLLGPRQVGKSTFLMQQWAKIKNAEYITFDKRENLVRAQRAPEHLILSKSDNQNKHLIIDEAQKVPHIFDSIKAVIDEKKRVGKFTLSGSVDFSKKAGVKESLAGRIGISRLYPMTLRELNNLKFEAPWVTLEFGKVKECPVQAAEIWLERGGMPSFCRLKDSDERTMLINSWIEAICYHDLKQLKDAVYDSDAAFKLLQNIALHPKISFSKLAHELGHTVASVKKHISALESLYLVYTLPSIENPNAQPIYKIFDSAVLKTLLNQRQDNQIQHSSLVTLVINEILAQYEYSGNIRPELYYYNTRGGAEIDLVVKTKKTIFGIQCTDSVDISAYAQRGMNSFLKRYNLATGYFVAPVTEVFSLNKRTHVIPWKQIG